MDFLDPFNRTRLPGDFSREGRVALLGEFFSAIRERRLPSEEARVFVASGALSWLEQGGDLLRDFWKITAPAGSHHTPSHVWSQRSSRGAQAGDEVPKMDGIEQQDSFQ